MGDAAGISPEVIVKALAEPAIRRAAKFIIFGMNEQLCYAADKAEIEPFWADTSMKRSAGITPTRSSSPIMTNTRCRPGSKAQTG